MIRIFDFLISLLFITILLPVFALISLLIFISSGWPIIFKQTRVGLYGKDFKIVKFRTMRKDAEKKGQLTVGMRDDRITPIGYFLRKYKLDELPQFWNVLLGQMSVVGPRPEVRRYVNLYNIEQMNVLNVRPGITDDATIRFRNENLIMGTYSNPEEAYIKEILPHKLKLSNSWIDNPTLLNYFRIIWETFKALFQ
jgi:lipopolysaccharide/colanic/teichoic acid biosynthesis glycosyltransferase